MIKLKKARAYEAAVQCRQMGLKVGDTIVGRETYRSGAWSEAKLLLLFTGKETAVWKVWRRSSNNRRWRVSGEQANWTLDCREWWLLSSGQK